MGRKIRLLITTLIITRKAEYIIVFQKEYKNPKILNIF